MNGPSQHADTDVSLIAFPLAAVEDVVLVSEAHAAAVRRKDVDVRPAAEGPRRERRDQVAGVQRDQLARTVLVHHHTAAPGRAVGEVRRRVLGAKDENDLVRSFTIWVREEIVPLVEAEQQSRPPRKNGNR